MAFTTAVIAEPDAAQQPGPAAGGDATARSKALELAGAFSNDGYKIRDGFFGGTLEPSKPLFVEVNLFAGNEYWVSAAALAPARKIALTVYNEKGQPIEGDLYEDGPSAAAGVEPENSGRYFIKIEMTEGEKADFCLLYCYK